jgi:hypothetical protein
MDRVEAATFVSPGSPPITQITFPACRAQYPGGPNRCVSVSSLFPRPSPVNWRVGIHDFTFEACSGFTRVTACKVAARPQADSCPEASTRPVTRPDRSVATMSHRQLHRWILLPLAICAVGAHSQPNARPSTERLRELTLKAGGAPFRANRPTRGHFWRKPLFARIGHFEGCGLAHRQPEGGESS